MTLRFVKERVFKYILCATVVHINCTRMPTSSVHPHSSITVRW